jgi:anthranilate phosphoribosyltransferase
MITNSQEPTTVRRRLPWSGEVGGDGVGDVAVQTVAGMVVAAGGAGVLVSGAN